MDINERAEKAVHLKNSGQCNCAQAVCAALADETGLSEEQMKQAAAGFGGGMGTMEATCGALIGAGIVAGLKSGGAGTVRYTRQLTLEFKEACKAVTCKDLKSMHNGKVLCPCDECVRRAVLAYGKVMGVQA